MTHCAWKDKKNKRGNISSTDSQMPDGCMNF